MLSVGARRLHCTCRPYNIRSALTSAFCLKTKVATRTNSTFTESKLEKKGPSLGELRDGEKYELKEGSELGDEKGEQKVENQQPENESVDRNYVPWVETPQEELERYEYWKKPKYTHEDYYEPKRAIRVHAAGNIRIKVDSEVQDPSTETEVASVEPVNETPQIKEGPKIRSPDEALRSIRYLLGQSVIQVRDSCKCPRCVDPSTRQRSFNFAEIPPDIQASSVEYDPNTRSIKIEWENDIPGWETHRSRFTYLQVLDMLRTTDPWDVQEIAIWDRELFEEERQDVDFTSLMNNDTELQDTFKKIDRHGLVFVQDVPKDEEAVKHLANRIGRLRNTFYGETWDVRSVPNAKNIAYTQRYLPYHMDLLYMREPPGIQLLHTLENTCRGGMSLFADTYKALDLLQMQSPDMVQYLKRQVRYTYANDGHFYTDLKPVIDTTTSPWPARRVIAGSSQSIIEEIDRVYWSPPFVGSINVANPLGLDSFVKACYAFSDLLKSTKLTLPLKMQPGMCVIFDNLRIVHARTAFDDFGGSRWLKGAYADIQDHWNVRYQLARKRDWSKRDATVQVGGR